MVETLPSSEARGEEHTLSPEDMATMDELRRRLEAETARADAEKARADAEKARADAEKARADAEKARADAAEARVLRLVAALRVALRQLDARADALLAVSAGAKEHAAALGYASFPHDAASDLGRGLAMRACAASIRADVASMGIALD